MATIEKQPETALTIAEWRDAGRSKASRYLSDRLTQTRSDYRSVAVATFVLGVAVAGACWLAFGIMLEHWLLVGGMPVWLRWAWLALGIAGLLAASLHWLVPLFRYRVNLLYAARSIEREFPELHNDLVNAVLVRPGESDPHGALITRSLEQRAARQLTSVPADGVFDKHHLVRLAFVLAVLVVLGTFYALLSPKNPFVTAARLLAPWSGWAAPSRVTVQSVTCYWASVPTADQSAAPQADMGESLLDPRRALALDNGSVKVIRGRQLVVAAEIGQLRQEEVPLIRATPLLDDGRIDPQGVPWQAALTRQGSDSVFSARLPDSRIGLDRSLRLELEAGDARWPSFNVLVVDAPSVLVREAVYHFPAYTQHPPETREWQGDLRGLEGTEVELRVESNQPLDAVWIDFLDTQRPDDLRMLVDREKPTLASVSLLLRRTADRSGPEHPAYRLRFRPQADRDAGAAAIIDEPLTHRIEVLPDLAPEVLIDLPAADPLRVPPQAPLRVRVTAVDPDYAVSSVRLETRPEGGTRPRPRTLWEFTPERTEEASGSLRMSARIVPAQEAGDASVLEYRAIVEDNRQPEPNSTATPWRRLLIDERASPQPDPDQAWPERRQPQSDTPVPGEGKPPGQDSADAKPRPKPVDERQPEQAAENQSPADRPPPDRQQPGQDATAEPGMQDASGTAGPQDGQGQQGQKASGQQAGQPGDGEGKPTGGNQAAGKADGRLDGQEQSAGGKPGEGNSSLPQRSAESSKTSAEGQGASQAAEASRQQQEGGKDRAEGGANERSRAVGNEAGSDGPAQQGKPIAGASQQQAKEASREATAQPDVPADGTDDGEAMERILDHQRRQDQNSQSKSQSKNQSGEKPPQQEACCPEEGKPCGKPGCSSCSGGGAGAGAGGSSGGDGQPGGGGNPAGAGEGQSGGSGAGQPAAAGTPGDGPASASSSAEGSSAGGGESTAGTSGASQGQPSQASGKPSGAAQSGDNSAGGAMPGDGSSESPAGGEGQGESQSQGDSQGTGPAGQSAPSSNTSPTGSQAAGQGEQSADGAAANGKQGEESTSAPHQSGGGGAVGGERQATVAGEEPPAPAEALEWSPEDLAAERHAVDLALAHLRDSVRSGDDGMLDELGWSREQAEAFLERWDDMREAAASGHQQRQDYEQTVRSLGLRPGGVRTSRRLPTDREGKRLEGRRTEPPFEYRERFKAYQKGTGSGRVEAE